MLRIQIRIWWSASHFMEVIAMNELGISSAILRHLHMDFVEFTREGTVTYVNRTSMRNHNSETNRAVGLHYAQCPSALPVEQSFLDDVIRGGKVGEKRILQTHAPHAQWALIDSFEYEVGEEVRIVVTKCPITDLANMIIGRGAVDMNELLFSIDPLSGAYSSDYFHQQLALLASESELSLSIVLIEVIHTSTEFLPELARAFVERIKSCTRRSDPLARLGSGQFGLLALHNADFNPIMIAQKVRTHVLQHLDTSAWSSFVSCSLSYATFRRDLEEVDDCLTRAKRALLLAKSSGPNEIRMG